MNEREFEAITKAKGYVRRQDGTWHKPPRRAVGRLEAGVAEPAAAPALDGHRQEHQGRVPRVAVGHIRVTIVAVRRRLLDSHDNARAACKPLVDAIAASLGVDDANPAVEWVYAQAKADTGPEGCLVAVERLI